MTEKKRPSDGYNDLARKQQQKIGAQLRQMYDEVANEPVPADFLNLLEQADVAKDDQEEEPGR